MSHTHQQHGTPPGWQPPSGIERALYEARMRGDWPAYYDVVAGSHLYLAQPRAAVEAQPDRILFLPYWNPHTRSKCLAVHTTGMLPAPVPDPVFTQQSLGWLARVWEPGDPPYLVVNPGSPCEGVLPATPEGRALWLQHDARVQRVGPARDAVHRLDVGGPLQGPVAFGLAVGAHLSVRNGEFWNTMGYHGGGIRHERQRLEEWWGITTREDWSNALRRLLSADMVSDVWEFVLQVRRSLVQDYAGPVSLEHWRDAVEGVLRARAEAAAQPRLTPDGVIASRTVSPTAIESRVAGVRRLVGRIARYEARFRADGLLPEDGYVRTAEAWDYGRAAGMARWGLGARYGTLAEAEAAVVRAGRLVHTNYRSWADFSAAYILGRCLHFDEEEFGEWYETALTGHRVLMSDPASPWLTIPWN
ncbi:DUF1266 domain-containing protein [Streptomyces sudanensis]|uniref:DUF1266 domain-containing protein n=2 Tax=Streptomyces TaxID=1883 RepID=A0ABY4TCR3_9ACTN|nr:MULTISPECIES: DUF1266 domain-containing protein [Streptomyces]URN16734.1 DUF1266 domain-containing protein [Streptomyces sudanensis]